MKEYEQKTEELENQIQELKEQEKNADKSEKEDFKKKISDKAEKLERYKPLSETDYILFYLEEDLETYKKPYNRYLADKLFNTPHFTTAPNEDNELFGTSNFRNGFNSSMPFLLHQTATFDISGRISDREALKLNEFQSILPRKVLPNPLPMFVFENETLNEKVISYFNENDGKVGYKEIITNLVDTKNKDKIGNYYLLFYQNTKDGLVFQDFDFVPKFDYDLKDEEGKDWKVEELFETKNSNIIGKISSVFEFQDKILPIIFNNNLIVRTKEKGIIYKYFDDIEEKYCKSSRNYLSILSYKKAFYDFVYKSQHQAITKTMFDDMMQVSILEDIRLDEIAGYKKEGILHPFHILNKLNIWFSLINYFPSESKTQTSIMASKLPHYRAFVEELAVKGAKLDTSTVKVDYFAFTAGQIIAQIFKQSKSETLKYQRLEVYLRVSTLADLIKVISLEFKKYKHGNYTTTFTKVLPFLTSYELDDEQLNDYLPQLLAGFFSETLLKPQSKPDSEKNDEEE
ncbi:hypothetical protein V9L05_18500 [Bernardetia sp. Wsw4-3y2]|uniref:hypothetical protein n=1 Tax=Bernardetia sp. Wsw4-3y2 TaxID=3127471 RepID=UPI0030D2C369